MIPPGNPTKPVHKDKETATEAMEKLLLKTRKRLLRMHYESGVGHLGGNLSCLDSLMVLYHLVLQEEDLFVLSKGHSAGALYAALWSLGVLSDEDLTLFHRDRTKLSGHPAPGWRKEIPFATGSLGHGLSLSCGLALAKKLKGEPGRVFCLTSDGEWEEGSNWEALLFAVHRQLAGLRFVVDWNGLQGFGTTQDVAGLTSLRERFISFGVPVDEICGHDVMALECALSNASPGPRAIIAHTNKGRGVSFMENRMEWHYLPLTESQYRQALTELGTNE